MFRLSCYAIRLTTVSRSWHSFCKTCIGRYNNTGVLPSPLCPATNGNARHLTEGNTFIRVVPAERDAPREWERSARARKESEREALALRRDLYLFQQVSHTLGHVRQGRSRSLRDLSSRYTVTSRIRRIRARGMTRYVLEQEVRESRFWENG